MFSYLPPLLANWLPALKAETHRAITFESMTQNHPAPWAVPHQTEFCIIFRDDLEEAQCRFQYLNTKRWTFYFMLK